MAITRLTAPSITGLTIPNTSINNASLDSVTALPGGIDTGKVGQVVSTTIGSSSWQVTTTTGSWLNLDDGTNDLELDITPSATSSKIFLMATARIYVFRGNAGNHTGIETRFLHNETTPIHAHETDGDGGYYFYDGANTYGTFNITTSYLHSPSSTSSQNYIFQMYFSGSQTYRYGKRWNTITAMEILA